MLLIFSGQSLNLCEVAKPINKKRFYFTANFVVEIFLLNLLYLPSSWKYRCKYGVVRRRNSYKMRLCLVRNGRLPRCSIVSKIDLWVHQIEGAHPGHPSLRLQSSTTAYTSPEKLGRRRGGKKRGATRGEPFWKILPGSSFRIKIPWLYTTAQWNIFLQQNATEYVHCSTSLLIED